MLWTGDPSHCFHLTTVARTRTVADMPPTSYELSFELAEVTDDVEDAIAERFDSLIATHAGITTVTLTATGDTCLQAALTAIDHLRALGTNPLRLVDDLVTRGDIAARAGVTPQAVGLWIRGERRADVSFPAPYVLAGGGLWLWGEVVGALADRGLALDGDLAYPTRRDIQKIGGAIASMEAEDAAGWSRRPSSASAAFTVAGVGAGQAPVSVSRVELTLAA